MLYPLHDLNRAHLDAFAAVMAGLRDLPAPWLRATASLLHRTTRSYGKLGFGLDGVTEQVIATNPFSRLLHFAREVPRGPRVLVVAPLSGHHATLVRDTIATLLLDHDVYVTEWTNAREVPLAAGTFSLTDYIADLRGFLRTLGEPLHIVAVCQPTVPTLAAVALDASDGLPTPRSLVLMGGPVDARRNPTVVCKLATDHSLAWFERTMIHRVPASYAGRGRRVYPGFLQLAAFVMMNPDAHARAHVDYWFARFRGDDDAARVHERFYDEYNAVLDLDAAFYLDTVRSVFQDFELARGAWRVAGQLVEPRAITRTPIFTIEGELDDISGLGQTAAALELCTGLASDRKRHLVATGCGHYGLFSGTRWRTAIYPEVRAFIDKHQHEAS